MLTDTHRKMLEVDSAISPEVIAARGYASVEADDERLQAFAEPQRRAGLLVPGWDIYGESLPGQIRPDNPRIIQRGDKQVELKYESPRGARAYVDVHPLVRDRVKSGSEALVITEGCRKADSAISQGLACVAILGVWGWRGRTTDDATAVVPDLDAIPLRGRSVLLAFDSDAVTKREVLVALKRFTAVLERYRANVHVVTWQQGA